MDVMGLQDPKTFTEWEKLREKIAETDAATKKVEELRQERRGKTVMAAARRAAARAKKAEEKQKTMYERTKFEVLNKKEVKGIEETEHQQPEEQQHQQPEPPQQQKQRRQP